MNKVVAIDGHNLALQRGTGVATYARNLANHVSQMGGRTQTLYGAPISPKLLPLLREISFFDYLGGTTPNRKLLSTAVSYVKSTLSAPFGYEASPISVSGKVEIARFAERLPRESAIWNVTDLFSVARTHFRRYGKFLTIRLPQKPDVMHWTYPLPIRVEGVPNIYTIHDLVPLRLPYTTLDNKRYYYRLIKSCLETSAHICTVSERSKTDIIELFGTPDQHISNTYQAVDTSDVAACKSQYDAELEVEGIFGLEPRSYFLFFGAIEPKKNIGRLVEAFLSARLNTKLVIVGSLAWKADEEMKLINAMLKQRPDLKRRIHVFDYTPRSFLVSLIRAAKAVVFPSLYEGFGLPVLEAMQLGTPTLCSTGGSLPEIAGDASVVVDPYDVNSIAQGLRQLEQDAELRHQLSVSGVARAQMFNSAAYADRLQAMYNRILP